MAQISDEAIADPDWKRNTLEMLKHLVAENVDKENLVNVMTQMLERG